MSCELNFLQENEDHIVTKEKTREFSTMIKIRVKKKVEEPKEEELDQKCSENTSVHTHNGEMINSASNKFVLEEPINVDHEQKTTRQQTSVEPTCYVCGRKFFSKKSLYGHMKTHPNRSWRGTKPDSEKKNISRMISKPSKQKSPNQDGLFLKWHVTAKRCRNTMEASTFSYRANPENLEFNAAEICMSFTNPNLQRSSAKLEDCQCLMLPADEQLQGKIEQRDTSQEIKIENEGEKNLKLEHNLLAVQINQKYKCNTCDKTFDSFQALGGHRGLHNKEKNTVKGVASSGETETGERFNGWHQCNECYKKFPTGQALGGHKRLHSSRKFAIESSKRKTRELNIDLNVKWTESKEKDNENPRP